MLLGLIAVGADASAQTGNMVPHVETIIARMVQARTDNRASFRSYMVTRDYTLFGKDRDNSKSQVIADVTFVPPGSKKYIIQRALGTGLGEQIVRRMLEGEAEIAKEYSSTDISLANYDFRFVRAESVADQLCYRLELLPRRKDQYLLRGNIWVDANTYLLRRGEGEPANKSPSWWLRNVRVKLAYGNVGGMWLQTASEATVNVRIFGQYTMVTRDLEYKFGDLSAVGSATQTSFSDISLSDLSATAETAREIVTMNRYMPLFYNASPGGMQWPIKHIGDDVPGSFGLPGYFVQQMFPDNRGDVVLPSSWIRFRCSRLSESRTRRFHLPVEVAAAAQPGRGFVIS